MFLRAVNCEGETKDKHFIASLMKEVVIEIGTKNVVQILTDNAPNCKAAGQIIETQYPYIFWTPCVVHTLNLALKNICAAKNVDNNSLVYDECSWINITIGDASIIKNFIMNHSMRLAIFNEFVPLKLLSVAETRFASSIVMLRRFKLIKQGLQSMVISTQWNSHRQDEGASFVRETLLNERWNKNNTPLHCLAHALNPRYYSEKWLQEDPKRVPPHKDEEVTNERKKCLKMYFDDSIMRTKANMEYAKFSTKDGPFADIDSIEDMWTMDPHSWWVIHGASAPTLQTIALKVLIQPSSSCCERNSFIHSLKRNRMTPQRAEDLVFVHSNLRLLSRKSPQYCQGQTKMWDIAGDQFGSLDEVGMLEVANLSLDEPEMEAIVFTDDGDEILEESMEVGSN
ncbi:hypothetical protein RHGRI_030653 [Rhododendron griersonianum]|uniref:DUF659 domain-containing protein n=1 Tax=Rhododendron griersonianum TaxID=479676 RepID=A0AAV6I4U6_9ERIC|nr:hypothetical protein RHGRI_030653 [Rhododendron griersonianum]